MGNNAWLIHFHGSLSKTQNVLMLASYSEPIHLNQDCRIILEKGTRRLGIVRLQIMFRPHLSASLAQFFTG